MGRRYSYVMKRPGDECTLIRISVIPYLYWDLDVRSNTEYIRRQEINTVWAYAIANQYIFGGGGSSNSNRTSDVGLVVLGMCWTMEDNRQWTVDCLRLWPVVLCVSEGWSDILTSIRQCNCRGTLYYGLRIGYTFLQTLFLNAKQLLGSVRLAIRSRSTRIVKMHGTTRATRLIIRITFYIRVVAPCI